jgi:Rab proteins geranylgeranyltransferase component A
MSELLADDQSSSSKSSMTAEDDDKFDVLIEGTGLTESILAAAAAWAGKRVLHVDKNAYYGSHWAALSIDQLDAWVQNNSSSGSVSSFSPR